MTFEANAAQILRCGLSLLVLCLVIRCHLKLRLFAFRQQLFSARNALFDEAMAGTISFDHPAYRMTRDRINALIRFAHRLNTVQLTLWWLVTRCDEEAMRAINIFEARLWQASADLPKEAQESIRRALVGAAVTVAHYLPLPFLLVRLLRPHHHREDMLDNEGVRGVLYEASSRPRSELTGLTPVL